MNYDLDLHYASVNDKCFPKYVRDHVPEIFRHIKGVKDIQRYVYSIESPVDRTYVGFDTTKHLKKCYYKFTYLKNMFHFNVNHVKFFWRKNNYKYLMIDFDFYNSSLDSNVIQQLMKSSKDFQDNCTEMEEPYPNAGKRTVPNCYNFIGYESLENLENAFNFDDDSQKYFKKYQEGHAFVDITKDPKEAYLFYNSL